MQPDSVSVAAIKITAMSSQIVIAHPPVKFRLLVSHADTSLVQHDAAQPTLCGGPAGVKSQQCEAWHVEPPGAPGGAPVIVSIGEARLRRRSAPARSRIP